MTPDEIAALNDRAHRNMAELGIPQGTDDPTLLALGATPLPMQPADTAPPRRIYWLSVDEMRLLDHWCTAITRSFGGRHPYICGSVLERADYRDVDLRILLSDDELAGIPLDVLDLNMMLSRWGQQATELPIDCQVQGRDEWDSHNGKPRHPRGML